MLRQTQQPLVELVEGRQNAAFPFLLFLFPLFFIRFAEIFMWLLYAILSAVFAALPFGNRHPDHHCAIPFLGNRLFDTRAFRNFQHFLP